MFNPSAIRKIRAGSSDIQLIYAMSLFDKDNNVIYRLVNADEKITINSLEYLPFYFSIQLPLRTADNVSDVSIKFANFSTEDVKREEIKRTSRIQVALYDKAFLDKAILQNKEYFLRGYTKTLTEITMGFTANFISDRKFPFTIYNSADHPRLYEED